MGAMMMSISMMQTVFGLKSKLSRLREQKANLDDQLDDSFKSGQVRQHIIAQG
jgi:hypothetical protein